MGEPIVLEDGRIAYGQAQAQVMRAEKGIYYTPNSFLKVLANPPFVPPPAQEAQTAEATPSTPFNWTAIKGVSTEIAAALNYIGLYTPQSLLAFVAMGGDLQAIPGIGKKRAPDIVKWAEDQL